jgi:hypothetical protein
MEDAVPGLPGRRGQGQDAKHHDLSKQGEHSFLGCARPE